MIARMVTRMVVVFVAAVGALAAYIASPASLATPSSSTFSITPPAPVVACPGEQRVPVGDIGAGGDLASEPTRHTYNVYAPVATSPLGDGQLAVASAAAQV